MVVNTALGAAFVIRGERGQRALSLCCCWPLARVIVLQREY